MVMWPVGPTRLAMRLHCDFDVDAAKPMAGVHETVEQVSANLMFHSRLLYVHLMSSEIRMRPPSFIINNQFVSVGTN